IAAIRCWARCDAPALEAETVWALAVDVTAEPSVRCAALRAVEETNTFDPARVKAALPVFEPPLLYFAARCLVRAGDETGIRVLCDLAGVADDAAEADPAAPAAAGDAAGGVDPDQVAASADAPAVADGPAAVDGHEPGDEADLRTAARRLLGWLT